MINTSSLYDNHLLVKFQEEQRKKIEDLQQLVKKLQEEIRILEEFYDRLDDL